MLNPCNKAELKFVLGQEIGKAGHNSTVFRSTDQQLDAEIAIKRIEKATFSSADAFFNESRALYASAHPHVIQIHYACYDADYIYLAMPFYPKGSLGTLISRRYLTVREIVTFGCHILSALHNIHSKGLIHFDVKPDNVLFSNRCEALLSDFGLAKQMNYSGLAQQDEHYFKMLPPEATSGDRFTRTFDIYQFGLTLYQMCNGSRSFRDHFDSYGAGAYFDRKKFLDDLRLGTFPNRESFMPHIPVRLRRIVAKCIAPNPAARYQSALEVANWLAEIEGENLDWQFTEAAGSRFWTKNKAGTLCELIVRPDGATECFKTVGAGKRRRFTEGCTPKMTDTNIRTFLGAH